MFMTGQDIQHHQNQTSFFITAKEVNLSKPANNKNSTAKKCAKESCPTWTVINSVGISGVEYL